MTMQAMLPVIRFLEARRADFLDRMVTRILDVTPRYTQIDTGDLRGAADRFLTDFIRLVDSGASRGLNDAMVEVARRRVGQGIPLSDYLRAHSATFPVIRRMAREAKVDRDEEFIDAMHACEEVLDQLLPTAADVYADTFAQQLRTKNLELNQLNQQLRAHERALSLEAEQAGRALQTANEFNQRVIQSLSSGLVVIDARTRKITLFSHRLEEILGIPAETMLDRDVVEAFGGLGGFDPLALVEDVRLLGRLPLTKLRLTLLDGRVRSLYVRAERLLDPEGNPEGTVVVVDDISEREFLVDSFSRYVSRDLVTRLLARAKPLQLEGERQVCTILFADIRGFTSIAEGVSPEALHEMLNSYFRVMIGGITGHGGFIDKFIGDKVMALFSGTEDPSASAGSAIEAAREIKKRIDRLSEERRAQGRIPIDVGIGVNTGEVILGNVGSEERMDFTAIGDAVNVADRLQSIARAGEVLIGEETERLTRGRFPSVDRGLHQLKGRGVAVRVFELTVR